MPFKKKNIFNDVVVKCYVDQNKFKRVPCGGLLNPFCNQTSILYESKLKPGPACSGWEKTKYKHQNNHNDNQDCA